MKKTQAKTVHCPCCGGCGRTDWATCDLCRGSGEVPDPDDDLVDWELAKTQPELSRSQIEKIVDGIATDFFDPNNDTLEF